MIEFCSRTKKKGGTCGHRALFWPPGLGPDPASCVHHLTKEERAAWNGAEEAARAAFSRLAEPDGREAALQPLPPAPACWSWPVPDNLGALAEHPEARADIAAVYEGVMAVYPEMRARAVLGGWQAGRCAICGGAGAGVTDHDHATGLVRGYLCHRCNILEGLRPGAPFDQYRERHPTAILGLTIRYRDPFTGEHAAPLRERRADRWKDNAAAGLSKKPSGQPARNS